MFGILGQQITFLGGTFGKHRSEYLEHVDLFAHPHANSEIHHLKGKMTENKQDRIRDVSSLKDRVETLEKWKETAIRENATSEEHRRWHETLILKHLDGHPYDVRTYLGELARLSTAHEDRHLMDVDDSSRAMDVAIETIKEIYTNNPNIDSRMSVLRSQGYTDNSVRESA